MEIPQGIQNALGKMWAETIGRDARAKCPNCGSALTAQAQILADYEVIETFKWNDREQKWVGGQYRLGPMASKLKNLKEEEGWGELDIYCKCGWFSEERGIEGVSKVFGAQKNG